MTVRYLEDLEAGQVYTSAGFRVLKANVSGRYKRTPFFDPESGKPVAVPGHVAPDTGLP